jgi:hypothetical protein
MCGPKEADPRLACQQATGKTSNQSQNMYTPAVAGYVDESNVMKYFDKMVNCFREIEARGFCVVVDERHDVFINVLVVADMSYLHKYQLHPLVNNLIENKTSKRTKYQLHPLVY